MSESQHVMGAIEGFAEAVGVGVGVPQKLPDTVQATAGHPENFGGLAERHIMPGETVSAL